MKQLTEQQAVAELGFTPQAVNELRSLPLPQAQAKLTQLKIEAKKLLRQALFKYHPDRNQGAEEVATANFTLLREVAKKLDESQLRAPQPLPMISISMGPFPMPMAAQFRTQDGFIPSTSVYTRAWDSMSTSSTTSGYVAQRVVYVKPR